MQHHLPDLNRWRNRQLAVVAIAALVVIAIATNRASAPVTLRPGHPVPHAAKVNALFAGLPENGSALGRADAPVTLVEYADLQCPACATVAGSVLPGLLGDVRAGRLRILLRPLALLGSDSERAALMALAVGRQNRLWQFVELFYANQQAEGSDYVTDTFLRALAGALPGCDVALALHDRGSPAVLAGVSADSRAAAAAHVHAVPTLLVGPTGGRLRALPPLPSAATIRAAVARLPSGTTKAGDAIG